VDADIHWQMRRRQLEEREHELLEGLDGMGLDELRWTVRYLADSLTEERWQTLLAGYHELLPVDRSRAFLQAFVSQCTQLAILDLEAKQGAAADRLQAVTDTDLQSMSLLEKWEMIAAQPRGLDPGRLARELARLALCFQPDLLHDAMLPRAVIEFPLYFELLEALRRLPPDEISRLSDLAAASVPAMKGLPATDVLERLAHIQREIAQAAGLTAPLQERLGASMDRLPKEFFPIAVRDEEAPDQIAEAARRLEGLSPEELRSNLQVRADQMSLREFQELLGPHRSKYPSLSQMPVEALRQVVATVSLHLGNRGLTDFIQRFRTGKFVAIPRVSSEVWNLMPQEHRLRLLEEDNTAMDIAQVARHLARILLSHEYQMLDDEAAQMDMVTSPLYQTMVQRLLRLAEGNGQSKLLALHQAITRMALVMESVPREGRGEALELIRRTIGKAVGFSEAEMSPQGTGGG
jgi:hypothetical protein